MLPSIHATNAHTAVLLVNLVPMIHPLVLIKCIRRPPLHRLLLRLFLRHLQRPIFVEVFFEVQREHDDEVDVVRLLVPQDVSVICEHQPYKQGV